MKVFLSRKSKKIIRQSKIKKTDLFEQHFDYIKDPKILMKQIGLTL